MKQTMPSIWRKSVEEKKILKDSEYFLLWYQFVFIIGLSCFQKIPYLKNPTLLQFSIDNNYPIKQ